MRFPINEQRLQGNWRNGSALDLHTIASNLRADGGFDTQRTALGETLYQLKYHADQSKIEPLADVIATFLQSRRVFPKLSAIIPVPPSDTHRSFQPVERLAIRIGEKTGLLCLLDYLVKIKATQALKTLEDPVRRREQLKGAFEVGDLTLSGKSVVLFDDIYRSGETLRAITEVLHSQGKIQNVYVLTVTKTRTKR
ncbi:MAG: ComF family protein [Chloroflexota bacterium]|nr:ComF family protein [Chloroflexota bacterium]